MGEGLNAPIVAVHRYFWPDTPPYASILRAILDRWAELGSDVTMFTAQPSYGSASTGPRPRNERLGGISVKRVPVIDEQRFRGGKLFNLFLFPLEVAARIVTGPKPDVVMCATVPQVTMGAAASLAAKLRGAAFVYHCMDLHPEIGRISGEFRNPVVYRLLRALDIATMRRASAVVVLSEDMRKAVADRDPALSDRVVVLNNFAQPDYAVHAEGISPLPEPEPDVLRIVFTGNLGRFQRLDEVVEALSSVDRPTELVFMGEGQAAIQLRAMIERLPPESRLIVRMVSAGTPTEARALMASAHLGLVSLAPDVIRYAYPSKTATYACEGLPLLAYCDADSELSRMIVHERLGWTASGPEELVEAVRSAADELSDPVRLKQIQGRVRSFSESEFGPSEVLRRWESFRETLLSSKEPRPGGSESA